MADSVPHSSKERLLHPAKKAVVDHWFLKLLLPLQKPSKEEAAHSRPLSEGNKDDICFLGVSDSGGLCCTLIPCQAQSLGAFPCTLSPGLLNHTLR